MSKIEPLRILSELSLKRALPILMVVDLAVPQTAEQLLHVGIRNRAPQPDFAGIGDWHENRRFVGDDPEMIEPARGAEDGLVFDTLDNAKTMVRVNDLVTDLESHESPVCEEGGRSQGMERVEPS